jgi:glycopeptide antibiotics resistance protein
MRLLSLIWTVLWMTWLTTVIYILTYPLTKFDGYPHWDNIRWIPFEQLHFSTTDIFETTANILIFVPLGYLTVRAWRTRTNHPLFLACLVSLLCSASAEFYQLFCQDRVPATTDLITNLIGGAIGAYAATLVPWSLRQASVRKSLVRLRYSG